MKRMGKVLVVEDDPRWSDRLRKYLEESGFHVTTTTSKEDALKILENEFFHFATIDLQLDEKSLDSENFEGWSVLNKIRDIVRGRMDILILSGFEEDENKKKASKIYGGELLFMKKSEFDKDEFINTVVRMVNMSNRRFKDDHRD